MRLAQTILTPLTKRTFTRFCATLKTVLESETPEP